MNLRAAPRQSSPIVASLPVGTRVVLLGTVPGEAVDPAEARWWHVVVPAASGGAEGYVYYTLVVPLAP